MSLGGISSDEGQARLSRPDHSGGEDCTLAIEVNGKDRLCLIWSDRVLLPQQHGINIICNGGRLSNEGRVEPP